MGPRKAGAGLLVAGILLWLAATLASPYPVSPLTLEEKARAEGTVDTSRTLLAVGVAVFHSYDAQNDTTWFRVAMCNHSPCGPVVALAGDLRSTGLAAPHLLDPVDDQVSLGPAPPRDETALAGPPERPAEAFSSRFEVRSPWPPFLPRLLALTLAVSGLAMVVHPRWLSAAPGVLSALVGLGVTRGASYIILSQLAIVPLLLAAFIAGAVEWSRRRTAWVPGGILLFAVAELAASFLALGHFPHDGGD